MTGPAPRPLRLADLAGSPYARPHPAAPQPVLADPGANLLPADPHHPRVLVPVPEGFLMIEMANGTPTSVCDSHTPGDLCVVPAAEGRDLVRTGYARLVITG